MADMPAITSSSTAAVASIQASSVMATMDKDGGNVRIDWSEVEKQAQGNDGYLRCVAQMLLAVRDKKWKPIE